MIMLRLLFTFMLCIPIPLMAQAIPSVDDSVLTVELNFGLDRWDLSQQAKAKVDSILEIAPVTILKRVEVYGHTDSLAGVEYNRELSKRRVLSIMDYLAYQGLDALKLRADYYGEERPKYDNGPDERYRNRRCELFFYPDYSLMPQPEESLRDKELVKGDRVRISNLQFVGNQPIPEPESFEAMHELLLLMRRNPDLRIEIQGHVCCSDDQRLSEERAWMVYHFLENNGVDPSRMRAKGFSNSKPLFRERSEKEKALNRRVEIEVLDNSERRLEVTDADLKFDLKAPVMGVEFMNSSGRLTPAGDFALHLIAESMARAEDLQYEFVVFDNIADPGLTRTRSRNVRSTLLRKKADRNIFEVSDEEALPRMPETANNLMLVHIKKR